ncbi:hypothetical protein LguiB_002919 [Lonicera macranthoides]
MVAQVEDVVVSDIPAKKQLARQLDFGGAQANVVVHPQSLQTQVNVQLQLPVVEEVKVQRVKNERKEKEKGKRKKSKCPLTYHMPVT